MLAVLRLFGELSRFLISWFTRCNTTTSAKTENVEETEEFSLLDLPDLALECILERLSPSGLRTMAAVCTSLKEMCTRDHFWEKHMKQKWDGVMGNAAFQQWQCYIASRNLAILLESKRAKGFFEYFSILWANGSKKNEIGINHLAVNSVMAWYLAIETGKFWFPAQVNNRENGNLGFMLSCYDAELSYDLSTDTFTARYPTHRRRTVEDNIEWNRIRALAVDTPTHVLHISDCLYDLKPGDHIEIQWRRNKAFPYGWWYGVVGHLESCNGNESHCLCPMNDIVVLEFKQYTPGTRWRQKMVNRKDHCEVSNGADGFYGGIRKLCNEREISTWKRLWPVNRVEE